MSQRIGEIVVLQDGVAYSFRHHPIVLDGGNRLFTHRTPYRA